jgi:mxaJ protein
MFSLYRRGRTLAHPLIVVLLLAAPTLVPAAVTNEERVLRIAADPNNLPFSNDKLEGFENKIAEIIAKDLGARMQWVWRAQRRGFFRETLKENIADVVMGAPAGFERALTTKPYYRSTYVFVTRGRRGLKVDSFDDPALRTLRLGVHLIGDDGANTPPAHALAVRGIVTNVVGYTIYGDYAEPNPPARLIEAVASGEVDVAGVWGPFGGYFSKISQIPLNVFPVRLDTESPSMPMSFGISVAVRRGQQTLRDEIQEVLTRRKTEIDGVLDDYGLPRVEAAR